jgi:DNA-binding LytR/AlgR family response regulator
VSVSQDVADGSPVPAETRACLLRAIAIDDEPPALKVVENFCSKVDFIQLEKTFTRANEALRHLRKFPVDLLFLDVQMPSLSGIDLYKQLEQHTMVIFTTAYSEYAIEGFNLNAVDYLLKPFTFERFLQAVNKARDLNAKAARKETAPNFILLRADYSLVKVLFTDILLIEGLDDYLKIHLASRKPLVVRMTMKGIAEKLPEKEFIRVHRSFIVPFSRIEGVRNKVISVGGLQVPIGNSYEESFFSIYKA